MTTYSTHGALGAVRFSDALLGAWVSLVTVLLLLPEGALPLPSWSSGFGAGSLDKAVHALLFFVLVLLAVPRNRPARRFSAGTGLEAPQERRQFVGPLLLIVILSSAYGALLEVAQLAVASRSFELADILADVVGSGAGGIVVRLAWRG